MAAPMISVLVWSAGLSVAFCSALGADEDQGSGQCVNGACEDDVLSALQVRGDRDASSRRLSADCGEDCPLQINTPRDFIEAMKSAVSEHENAPACKKTPKVASDLFGSIGLQGPNLQGRGVNFSHPVPPYTSSALVFWSPAPTLPAILTSCCNATSAGDCACRILREVGSVAPQGQKLFEQRFLVVKGTQNNQLATSTHNKNVPLNTIKPTWDNLAKFTPDTFDVVFAGLDWKSKCPTGEISSEVVSNLNRFKSGCVDNTTDPSYTGSFLEFIKEFDVKQFKIACPSGCASCDHNHAGPPPAKEFLDMVKGETLCTDTAAVRSYMLWYFDTNANFEGTGHDEPTDKSPGGDESVTIPNLLIDDAGGAASQWEFFQGNYTC